MYLKSKSHRSRLYSVIQSKLPFHKDWVITCENRATGDLFREEVHESRGRLQDTKDVTPESGRGRLRAIFKTFGLETFFFGGGGRQGLKIEKAALTQNLQTKQLETGYHQFTFYICQTEEILV